jgi:hypothetical protein
MKYLQIVLLLCLLIACNDPSKTHNPNFDFSLSYIQNLKEGDSISQAYLEAYIKFQRGDSLAKVPFSLSVADTLYHDKDKYPHPKIPLKYVLSMDTNNHFFREDDVTYSRVPKLSNASLQVYEGEPWIDNVLIFTRLFNLYDKHPLLVMECWHMYASSYRIFAPQKNGFWKLLKVIITGDVEDDILFHQAFLVDLNKTKGTTLYAWREADFSFAPLNFPDLNCNLSHDSYLIAKNAQLDNFRIFGSAQYSAHTADTLEMAYVWDLDALILLSKGDTSFRLGEQNIIPKTIKDPTFRHYEAWENVYFTELCNHWHKDEQPTNSHEQWTLFAKIDSLQSTWVWDNQQKAYNCIAIGAANGLFSKQLKTAWDIDKLLCLNDPEKFKTLAVPPFEKLSGDYKNFVYSDSLVQIGWQMLDILIHKNK